MNINRDEIERIVREVFQQKQIAGAPSMPVSGRPLAAASENRSSAVPARARAAVLVEKKRLEIKEFPLRKIREDEILVRVEDCGICGTDIHCYNTMLSGGLFTGLFVGSMKLNEAVLEEPEAEPVGEEAVPAEQ